MQLIELSERWSLPIGKRVLLYVNVGLVSLGLATAASAATSTQTKSKHHHSSTSHSSSSKHFVKTTSRAHGQRTIDEERTAEIQTALIREHYLAGQPTGTGDKGPKTAMLA